MPDKVTKKSTKWFSFKFRCAEWTVYVSNDEVMNCCNGSTTTEGVCYSATCEIHISDKLNPTRRIAVLGHELVHAMCAEQNAESLRALTGSSKSADTYEVEERLAVFFGPAIMEILTGLPGGKIPAFRAAK